MPCVTHRFGLFLGEPSRNPNHPDYAPSQFSHQRRPFDAQDKLDRFERATKRRTNTSAGNDRATLVESAGPTDNHGDERNITISGSVEIDANRESEKTVTIYMQAALRKLPHYKHSC